jgi:putative spermidine/putrescine transport system ATP-binding protein
LSSVDLPEPLSALDASVRGHLRDQIRAIQQRFNATTLLVTHDQEEALTMADRVAVLQDGRLMQIAAPRELYQNPANSAVARFVGLSTLLPGTVRAQDRVDLGFTELAAPTGARTPGTAVQVLIRPEHVRPDPAPGSPNRLTGRAGAQRYLGALTRYDFEVPGAPRAFLAESAAAAREAIGIAPEHVRLLDE